MLKLNHKAWRNKIIKYWQSIYYNQSDLTTDFTDDPNLEGFAEQQEGFADADPDTLADIWSLVFAFFSFEHELKKKPNNITINTISLCLKSIILAY